MDPSRPMKLHQQRRRFVLFFSFFLPCDARRGTAHGCHRLGLIIDIVIVVIVFGIYVVRECHLSVIVLDCKGGWGVEGKAKRAREEEEEQASPNRQGRIKAVRGTEERVK